MRPLVKLRSLNACTAIGYKIRDSTEHTFTRLPTVLDLPFGEDSLVSEIGPSDPLSRSVDRNGVGSSKGHGS